MRTVIASLAGLVRRRPGQAASARAGGGLVRRRRPGQEAGWSGGGLVRLAGPGLEVSAVLTCGRAKAFSASRLLAHPGASPDGYTRPLRRPPRRSRCRPRSGRPLLTSEGAGSPPDPACLNCTSAYTGGLVGPVT